MTIVHTTYGRTDIDKMRLELLVMPVGNKHAVTAKFSNNGLHRTIELFEHDVATTMLNALAKFVKKHEFPWMDDLGVRQWTKIEQHGFFDAFKS